ncbi:MAG TPA: cysteine synthase A [Dehalococcoidales bacterium]|nr:cysteine synthase A [Dehalococcoidales bacterium]
MTRNVLGLIGNTPIVKLAKLNNTKSTILAKLEALNPSGSIKDVMALYMTNVAEKKGILKPGNKIIEETSGNTGIAFAMIAALKGYKFVAVMPEHMSLERKQLIKAFGAEVVLTPEEEGFPGALERLEQLARENKDAWLPKQFENRDNIAAHREITGRNILQAVGDKIDVFVAGVGTGGTLMGVAEALKQANRDVRIVAVEPAESAVMTGEEPGSHIIQGIGPGFIPSLVNMDLIDEVIKVKSDDAVAMARRLFKEEGLMVGISSGANVLAALEVAQKSGRGKTIVTILPDRGERYLSMNLF